MSATPTAPASPRVVAPGGACADGLAADAAAAAARAIEAAATPAAGDAPTFILPQLLTGCEAAARGAWEAGAHALASYPGSPVTGIVEAAGAHGDIDVRWAANEKVALEIAAGVAYSGGAAIAVMKHVGLNVAADPLFNLAYTGVRGALVIVVGDDPGASCSQNEQDTRRVAAAAQLPVLEPSDVNEILLYTRLAFELSRDLDLPVLVRLTTQLCYATQPVVPGVRRARPIEGGFAQPAEKFLLLPAHVPARHRALLAALERMACGPWAGYFHEELWPDAPAPDGGRWPVGLVCAGHTAAQCREHFEGAVPILKVGCAWPVAADALRRFAARCERLVVTEECSDHLAQQVRALGLPVVDLGRDAGVGEFRVARLKAAREPVLQARLAQRAAPPLRIPVTAVTAPAAGAALAAPARPPGFCAGCSHVGAFDVLRRLRRYVAGDIGCYTLGATPAFGALHANLCMGASVGVLLGYLTAQPQRRREVIGVIGDSTFFHSGLPAVLTAAASGAAGTLLVLDNSGTAMTGFQRTAPNLDEAGWLRLLDALGVRHRAVVAAFDVAAIERHILAFDAVPGFAVIVVKGACVQASARTRPTNFRYTVVAGDCTGCGECRRRTDCPALVPSIDNGRAEVRISDACVGCGMCAQTCPERAILPLALRTGVRPVDRALTRVAWEPVIRFIRGHRVLNRVASLFERAGD